MGLLLVVPVAVTLGITVASASITPQLAGNSYLLDGIACTSASTCQAVGQDANAIGVVSNVSGGDPASAVEVPGTENLENVACYSATSCVAVGESSGEGEVVLITSGTPGDAQPVPGTTYIYGIACSSSTSCEAVGENALEEGVIVPISSGTAGSAVVVSGTVALGGIACTSSSACEAVGYDSNAGVVVPITSGSPGAPVEVSGTDILADIACSSSTNCETVGLDDTESEGVVVPVTGGTPGSVQSVPGAYYLNGVACPNATTCEAVGVDSSDVEGGVVPIPVGGSPGSFQGVSGTSILYHLSCPSSSSCESAGQNSDEDEGLVVTVALPSAPTAVAGVAEASAVSLSWTAPSSTGSSAISSYDVTPYIGGTAQTPIDTNSTAASYTVTGLTDGQAYTFTVAAVNGQGEGPASVASSAVTPTAPHSATYTPLTPYRICDTRAGNPSQLSGLDLTQCQAKTLGAGQTLTIQVAGTNPSGTSSGGVPSSATSVILNVTVTDPTQASYLTVWPAGGARPLSSSVNWSTGQSVPNLVTVGVSSSGDVSLYNANGNADVIVDVEGWMDSTDASGDPYLPLTPYRICDTRSGNPSQLSGLDLAQCEGDTLSGPGLLTIQATGTNPSGTSSGGVPASGVLAVDLTVTATNPTQNSYLTVWPAGDPQPTASNLNFVAGQTVANNVVVAVTGTDAGKVDIYNPNGNTDVIVDVSGYYGTTAGGADFTPMVPNRICDTRATAVSGLDDACTGLTLGARGSGGTLTLQVAGGGGIPSGVTSVILNVTVTDTTASDYLTIYPDGQSKPLVSSMNWNAGETVASGVTATVGSDGEIDFYIPNGQADLVVDVVGWIGS